MAGGGNSREENYWPGFVDALANVVLTLVFVLVVFVFALAMMANKASKVVEQLVQERVNEEKAKMAKTMTASGGKSESTALLEDGKGIELQAQEEQKQGANRGAVQIDSNIDDILLVYPESVLELDEPSMEKLKQVLSGHAKLTRTAKVVIKSYQGQEAYSLAQRLAYYRAIKIRNTLIDGGLIEPGNVSNRILPPENNEQGHVRIIFSK